jgi:hypothetical protein
MANVKHYKNNSVIRMKNREIVVHYNENTVKIVLTKALQSDEDLQQHLNVGFKKLRMRVVYITLTLSNQVAQMLGEVLFFKFGESISGI